MDTFRFATLALGLALSASGLLGQSQHLDLDGNSGLIYSTPGGVAGPLPQMTIEYWLNLDSLPIDGHPTQWNYVIWQENSGSGAPLFSQSIHHDGRLRVGHHVGAWKEYISTGAVGIQGWHHVAITYDAGGDVEFYIDGVTAGHSPAIGGPVVGGLFSCSLGFEDALDRQFLDGAIDEFRIWSVARSGTEIAGTMFSVVSTHPDLLMSMSFEGSHASSVGGFSFTTHGNPSFGSGQSPNLPAVVPRPGSGEDFILATGVNALPSQGLVAPPPAAVGDQLIVHIESPLGGYDFTPPVLYAQMFQTGIPPFPPVDYPEVYLDFAPGVYFQILTLYTGFGNPFSTGLLPPGGMTFAYSVPGGLSGLNLMIQGFVVAPSTNTGNGWFTATDARAIRFN